MKFEYDVALPNELTKVDMDVFKEFVLSDTHKNIRFTYDSKFEAQKRRACFRTWLGNNKIINVGTAIDNEKLYCFKISEDMT